MNRNVVGLVLVAAVLAGGLWWLRRQARAAEQNAPSVESAAMAQRFHRGAPPCLRYADRPAPAAEIETTAALLLNAGIESGEMGKLFGEALRLTDERETAAHAEPQFDEYWHTLTDGQSWPVRAVLGFRRSEMQKLFETPRLGELKAEGAAALAVLPPERQQAFRAAFEQRPETMVLASMPPLLQTMRVGETHALLERVRAALAQRGTVPESFDELLPAAERVDPWGEPLRYQTVHGVATVTSFGADRSPHGEGFDTDLTITWPEQQKQYDDKPLAPGCGPISDRFVVKQRELDDLAGIAAQARIVPHFVEGEARGFKFFSIKPGSLYARSGLCNGDILVEAGGKPITGPEVALEMYTRAKTAKSIPLVFERNRSRVEMLLVIEES